MDDSIERLRSKHLDTLDNYREAASQRRLIVARRFNAGWRGNVISVL